MARKHSRTTQKGFNNPDTHDGLVTDLETDILEWEVKWALEATLQTQLVVVMEFQLSYAKS